MKTLLDWLFIVFQKHNLSQPLYLQSTCCLKHPKYFKWNWRMSLNDIISKYSQKLTSFWIYFSPSKQPTKATKRFVGVCFGSKIWNIVFYGYMHTGCEIWHLFAENRKQFNYFSRCYDRLEKAFCQMFMNLLFSHSLVVVFRVEKRSMTHVYNPASRSAGVMKSLKTLYHHSAFLNLPLPSNKDQNITLFEVYQGLNGYMGEPWQIKQYLIVQKTIQWEIVDSRASIFKTLPHFIEVIWALWHVMLFLFYTHR